MEIVYQTLFYSTFSLHSAFLFHSLAFIWSHFSFHSEILNRSTMNSIRLLHSLTPFGPGLLFWPGFYARFYRTDWLDHMVVKGCRVQSPWRCNRGNPLLPSNSISQAPFSRWPHEDKERGSMSWLAFMQAKFRIWNRNQLLQTPNTNTVILQKYHSTKHIPS